MKNIKVKLINQDFILEQFLNTLKIIRVSRDSIHSSDSYIKDGQLILGEKDKNLMNLILSEKHFSTLEHITFTFFIDGISRLCLQELVRHRIASYTVKSTRYTLKKDFKNKEIEELFVIPFKKYLPIDKFLYEKYLNDVRDLISFLVDINMPLDKIKYLIPESLRTKLYMTINLRSLINFLHLRLSENAHFEIRYLANLIKDILEEIGIYKIIKGAIENEQN